MVSLQQIYLAVLAVLATAALVLTQLATDEAQGVLQQNLIILLYVDGALIIVMLITVVVMGLRLYRDYRLHKRGARLSWRITLLLLAVALVPLFVLYAVSANGVFRSIESWFDTPLDSAFEKGNEFSKNIIGIELSQLEFISHDIRQTLARRGTNLPFGVDQLLPLHQVDRIGLYDASGQLLLSSGAQPNASHLPAARMEVIAREGRYYSVLRQQRQIFLEVIINVANLRDVQYLSVSRPLSADITEGIVNIEQGWEEYKKLKILRDGLRWSFLITLSLSLVFILLVASWIAIRLGKRLASPLVQLSIVATAIGTGNFAKRVREKSTIEEINLVNRSFNKMARGLQARQGALQKAHAYLQNLLSAISVGILSFNAQRQLALCNRSAADLFGLTDAEQKSLGLDELISRLPPEQAKQMRSHLAAPPNDLNDPSELGESGDLGERWSEMRLRLHGRVLLVRIVLLSKTAGGGALLVASDITVQIQKERGVTWEEASKRLAHEIKNPLTPIRLAAERLERKLGGKLETADAQTLHLQVKRIVNQVTAMRKMVDAFRNYAAEQKFVAQAVDLNALIGEVLAFYEEGSDERRINFQVDLADSLPAVAGEPVLLRQMLHNLLKNASEATASVAAGCIRITTSRDDEKIVFTIADNGGGISDDLLPTICEPYVTTKPDGSGLGLAVIRKTVDEHQGELQIRNDADGACIRIRLLPFLPPQASDAPAADSIAGKHGRMDGGSAL